VLLKQAEDRAFEAADNLKSIQNDLADKEYALQAAQRKLLRQQQQQQQQQQHQAAPAAGGAGGAAASALAAAAAAGGEGDAAAAALQELQAQVEQLQALLEERTAEKDQQGEEVARLQRWGGSRGVQWPALRGPRAKSSSHPPHKAAVGGVLTWGG